MRVVDGKAIEDVKVKELPAQVLLSPFDIKSLHGIKIYDFF